MSELPKVKFIRSWQFYSVGDVIQPDSAIFRGQLIASRKAELCDQSEPLRIRGQVVAGQKPPQAAPVTTEQAAAATVEQKQTGRRRRRVGQN